MAKKKKKSEKYREEKRKFEMYFKIFLKLPSSKIDFFFFFGAQLLNFRPCRELPGGPYNQDEDQPLPFPPRPLGPPFNLYTLSTPHSLPHRSVLRPHSFLQTLKDIL